MPVPKAPAGDTPQTAQDAQYAADVARLKESLLFKSLPLYGSYSVLGGVDKRSQQSLMQSFQHASPEQRQQFLETLDYPDTRSVVAGVKQAARNATAQAIDSTGSTLGAYAGGVTLGPIGATTGEILGAVGADRLNRVLGLRDATKAHVPLLGEVENTELAGGITTGDVAAALPAAVTRGLGAAARGTTRGLQNLAGKADTKVQAKLGGTDNDLAVLRDKQFEADMATIAKDPKLSARERIIAEKFRTQEYYAEVKAAKAEVNNLYTDAVGDVPSSPVVEGIAGGLGAAAAGSASHAFGLPWPVTAAATYVGRLVAQGIPRAVAEKLISTELGRKAALSLLQARSRGVTDPNFYGMSPGVLAAEASPGASPVPESGQPVTPEERRALMQDPRYTRLDEQVRGIFLKAYEAASPEHRAGFLQAEEPYTRSPGTLVIDIEKDAPDASRPAPTDLQRLMATSYYTGFSPAERQALLADFHAATPAQRLEFLESLERGDNARLSYLHQDPAYQQYGPEVRGVIKNRFREASAEDQRQYLTGV